MREGPSLGLKAVGATCTSQTIQADNLLQATEVGDVG